MKYTNVSYFELARHERITELVKGAKKLKMDCADIAALEYRIAALERGLRPPSRDVSETPPMVTIPKWHPSSIVGRLLRASTHV